ncbi:phosphonate C-P lyase system protein PhnH [Roseobacter weihaiensis]|uniref:phosphonate C-P lyase system protein PhnH n=1 Tax=Roseobacter weihaiensis TaxID=2763262 RepID=UPI001D0BCF89|nr:phosphonate C-P lyase system protein PhnH [Roseobacter sp. H9]
MQTPSLQGGFAEPAREAAMVFRDIMTAMARPGQIETVAPGLGIAPLSDAAAAVVLTLCDADTKLYLTPRHDTEALRRWIAFHTGVPLTGPQEADFALGAWDDLTPLNRFRPGTADYPDQSATLIVECEALDPQGAMLSGPGIQSTTELSLPEVKAFRRNAQQFPLGLDFIFTAGVQLAAPPRSTKVT